MNGCVAELERLLLTGKSQMRVTEVTGQERRRLMAHTSSRTGRTQYALFKRKGNQLYQKLMNNLVWPKVPDVCESLACETSLPPDLLTLKPALIHGTGHTTL